MGTVTVNLGAIAGKVSSLGTAAFESASDFATAADLESIAEVADSAVQSVVPGTNVTVDDTDPQNPKVSAAGGSGANVTLLNPGDRSTDIVFADNKTVGGSSVTSGIIRSKAKITGKRYFEAIFAFVPSNSAGIAAGVATDQHVLTDPLGFTNPYGWAYWGNATGAKSNGVVAISGTAAKGDVFGFAVDESAGKIWISKNGTWLSGDPAAGTSPVWTGVSGNLYAAACPWLGSSGASIVMSFASGDWLFDAPTGFSEILL